MKRYKNFLIVGIDHGYGNIKTANTVTPKGITKLDAAPTFTKNTLFFDDSDYLIGEGHKEYLPDKWENNDNYLFTLMGIARELNREGIISADVHLAVGLPLVWVNRQREDFRKYMLQRESVDFKYEDKLYSVRIIGCSIFALLRKYEYDPKMMRLYITGGRGKLIENFGTYEKDRVTIIGDICASAKGYEEFAIVQLKKEGK